ncbi:3-hydroxy-acyl-CoA-dehydrogenase [Lentinula aff. lateritia]|uniref:3-hydroxy-acyl-CoA-dehydrogenase n=1 Tax=Lentinula aff. lateritia TaxID=2804960 RepID=A0ACC1U8Q6_9AGAR|nr:3-hydroxy-acyl-CoA-dehydrogenase [Lentinula aff. lateritia]
MSNFRDLVPYPVLQVFTQKFFASRSLPLEAQISFPTASQFILVQFSATRAVTQSHSTSSPPLPWLGLATVQELLRCDAYVAVLDLSPISAELVSDDASQNSRVLYIETDVTQEDRVESAVARVVEWTKSTGAHLGGVINGAGIAVAELTINRRGEPHSTRTWDRVLGINLTGTFYLTRLVAKHLVTVPREYELEEIASEREEEAMMMKESDGERGVIVMIASTVAYEGQAGQIAYAASKGAIRSMTLPMARDMSRYGVRVVTIAPGPFKTPMTGQFSQSMTDRLEKEAVLFPRRYGMPEEFAATVRWILECPYVNGETFKLTGGARVPAML